jgi:chemotaxis protein histidine kinase CheA
VAKYVEMMNGSLEIKSELEKGTEINLIFVQ